MSAGSRRQFEQAVAQRLVHDLARPRPLLVVFLGDTRSLRSDREDPFTGRRIIAVSEATYRRANDELMCERGHGLGEFVEIQMVSDHRVSLAVVAPTGAFDFDGTLPQWPDRALTLEIEP